MSFENIGEGETVLRCGHKSEKTQVYFETVWHAATKNCLVISIQTTTPRNAPLTTRLDDAKDAVVACLKQFFQYVRLLLEGKERGSIQTL